MGVCWDPKNLYVATQSCDRTVQIYEVQKNIKPGEEIVKNIGHNFKFLSENFQSSIENESETIYRSDATVPKSPSNEFDINFEIDVETVSSPIKKRLEERETISELEKSDSNISGRSSTIGTATRKPEFKLFHDDNMNSFFRRLEFLPDGELLLAPSGVFKCAKTNSSDPKVKHQETVYGWDRCCLTGQPSLHLPGHTKATVVVKSCPVGFNEITNKHINESQCIETSEISSDKLSQIAAFEYKNVPIIPQKKRSDRIIVAIASLKDVAIYSISPYSNSEEQSKGSRNNAISFLGDLHYGSITDLAWTPDGMFLLITSTDGFVSIVSFDHEEFGKPFLCKIQDDDKSTLVPEIRKQVSVEVLIDNTSPLIECGTAAKNINNSGPADSEKDVINGDGAEEELPIKTFNVEVINRPPVKKRRVVPTKID
ncbi:Chromatin assembly factor 1 subunit B [Smittium culicis]|uniref:Chromatin assembly factor 1 subunit B n=1 Tax=Smittium culicis TaxID=133412 RepID=A0A1R1XNJ7_9FUNG|nr:Chromatin assembly factor 1 subunit B [Smittium culicis]OMJ18082.1 Chromatin assembly factor 1 subunit B [Smittium culicis]